MVSTPFKKIWVQLDHETSSFKVKNTKNILCMFQSTTNRNQIVENPQTSPQNISFCCNKKPTCGKLTLLASPHLPTRRPRFPPRWGKPLFSWRPRRWLGVATTCPCQVEGCHEMNFTVHQLYAFIWGLKGCCNDGFFSMSSKWNWMNF